MFYIFTLFIVLSILYYKTKSIRGSLDTIESLQYKNIKDYNFQLNVPVTEQLKLGTSEKNNPYYIFGLELRKYFPIILEKSNGSNDNLVKLLNRNIDICLCQEDIAYDMYFGKNEFPYPNANLRFISGLFYELCTFVVQTDTSIATFTDISKPNKYVIGLPDKTSGSFRMFSLFLKILDIELLEYDPNDTQIYNKKIRYISSPINVLIGLFINNQIDGIFLVTTTKNIYLINLCKIMLVKFIPIVMDKKIIQPVIYPLFSKTINTSDYYISIHNSEKIPTFAVRSILLTRDDIDTQFIYLLTKTLFDNHLELKTKINSFLFSRYYHNYLEDAFIPSQMFYVDKKYPIHIGAYNYYKELGYISDNDVLESNNILCKDTVCKKFDPVKHYWKHTKKDLESDLNFSSYYLKI